MTTLSNVSGFADSSKDRDLQIRGYTTAPVLTSDDVGHLAAEYAAQGGLASAGFHATMYSQDEGYRRAVFSLIAPVVTARLRGILDGYHVRIVNWVVKEAGPTDSTVYFHQDWTF